MTKKKDSSSKEQKETVLVIVKKYARADVVSFEGVRITKFEPVEVSASILNNERQAQHLEFLE